MSESRELVARLVEIVNAGEVERLEEVASGEVAAAARRWIGPFRESFPDFRMETRGFFDLTQKKSTLAVQIGERLGIEIVVVQHGIIE